VAFGKKFLAKRITLSQIMDVVAWSFQMALNGSYPSKGYSGEILDDPYRRRKAGKDLGGVAFRQCSRMSFVFQAGEKFLAFVGNA